MGLLSMGVGFGSRLMGISSRIIISGVRKIRWFLWRIRRIMPTRVGMFGNLIIQRGKI